MMMERREAIRHLSRASTLAFFSLGLPGRPILTTASQLSAQVTGGTFINLADAGVSPGNDARLNRTNFQGAVDRAPPGATLVLPATGLSACRIDTSGGWKEAVQIHKPLALQIEGALLATHSATHPLPCFMLNVTAPGVRIFGTGRIIGDGHIDDANAGTDETLPGLIRVNADDFAMTGVELVSPPKVGLLLYQCRRAQIVRARFTGGPRLYRDTGHFAIRAAGGGQHVFEGNRFYPDPDGGMAVQCIMLSGSHHNRFVSNHAIRPFEKLVYGYGDRNEAIENVVEGNPDFIPGLNVQGTYTGVFRFHGSHNRVERNRTTFCAGGAQMMDGEGHIVRGNHFLSCGQSAITAYQSDLSGSIIQGNIATKGRLAGFVAGHGVHLVSDRGPASEVLVESNTISGFSVADPLEGLANWAPRTRYGRNSALKPRSGNGRYYVSGEGGSSGAREPTWPPEPGRTVRDGEMSWTAVAFEGGQAEIGLFGGGPSAVISDSVIANNDIAGGRLGIVTRHVRNSRIQGNRIEASLHGMLDVAGRGNDWSSNVIRGSASAQVHTMGLPGG